MGENKGSYGQSHSINMNGVATKATIVAFYVPD